MNPFEQTTSELKAEIDRLQADYNRLECVTMMEIARLRDEIARLRAKEQVVKDIFDHIGNSGSLTPT